MLSNEMQVWIRAVRQMKQASQGAVLTPEAVLAGRAGADQMASQIPIPQEIAVEETVINGICGEMQRYTGERPAELNDRVVLFIHGGGFATGSVASRRYLSATTMKYAHMDAFSMEYTQFPEGTHPEELVDAIRAFRGLQQKGYKPENIYLYGESGGAMICMMLSLYLKDHGLAMPGKICLFSPPANLAEENPSRSERDERDPMINGKINDELDIFLSKYDKQSYYISTVKADLTGFPKMLINVGTEEVLFDDCVQLAEKAKACGVDVELKIWEELFHVFTLFPAPETEEALAYCGRFLAE